MLQATLPTNGSPIDAQDLELVELPAAEFDVAYSSLALHYLADLGRILAMIHQSLVTHGVFVFSIEHPIYSAPSNQAFVTDAEGHVTWPLDSYQIEGPRTTDWLAPGVVKHHRTIGTYVSGLRSVGFRLDHLCEWAPSPEQIAEVPEWSVELERPQFLLVGARRN